mgnify:FL=1
MNEEKVLQKMEDYLKYEEGVSQDVIDCMTTINGWKAETYKDILYWKTGYQDFNQLDDGFYED